LFKLYCTARLMCSFFLIIFNSPINGRQYKKQHRKKRKKSGNSGN